MRAARRESLMLCDFFSSVRLESSWTKNLYPNEFSCWEFLMKNTIESRMQSVKRSFATSLLSLVVASAPLLTVGIGVGILMNGSVVSAQDTTVGEGNVTGAFDNVQNAVCNAAKALQGPVGIGIGFLVLVGGIIALQVASRDALPMIARAAFGTALLMGAATAFAAIVATPCA